jgi:hypothetical protein
LGAVQAQDYRGARWALGQRLVRGDDTRIEEAFDRGTLLRTHVLRPTWHFVSPADIRWLISLSAARLDAISTYYLRHSGIDAAALRRCRRAIERALRDGRHLTRAELMTVLRNARVLDPDRPGASQVAGHILFNAEVHGIVCSGPRRGKQFTYALLEERVPPVAAVPREEALGELARRYFASHGPATIKDFVWWSGLTAAEARTAIETNGSRLRRIDADGHAYWLPPSRSRHTARGEALLLPSFDEYMVAYVNRTAAVDPSRTPSLDGRNPMLLGQTVLADGVGVATWRRAAVKEGIGIEVQALAPLRSREKQAIEAAVERLARFSGQPARIAGFS